MSVPVAAMEVAPELAETYENLVGLRKKLQEMRAEPKKYSYEDVHHVQVHHSPPCLVLQGR